MTISSSPSDPLFVVVGATGAQGGSVVHALRASAVAYRVRSITRDPSKPAAKQLENLGSEVVAADVADIESLEAAFKGADIVFACTITDYFTDKPKEKEFREGKSQVDAALAAGVEKFVFSGLTNMEELSNGRLGAWSFDRKSDVVKYARSKSSSWDVYDVQPGCYASNFLSFSVPRPSAANDGTYTLALPIKADTKLPVVDISTDYGKYVVGAVEKGVKDVYTGVHMTPVEIAQEVETFSGKGVKFWQMPDEVFHAITSTTVNDVSGDATVAMYQCIRELGYYGDKDLKTSQETMINGPPKSFTQFLQDHRKEVDEVFAIAKTGSG